MPCCLPLLQDVQALAICCCKAASLLHQAGVVHRDIRLDNVAQLGKHRYMLLDLETVAAAGPGALRSRRHASYLLLHRLGQQCS